ncbi:hypothetical protein AVEN_62208-1 [Araneus ventricosus]|uniref:DNA-directed DNA polymerase n=1 Tax=Araneus ventricosus TaxID=182803 RepID=A0A4Y2W8M6_ARAVE|nr:hypothetical protein AVEN_62208-1 [Araneus ventricosus]
MTKYGDKARLLFTDTDSLCYEITTGDLNKDLERMKQYFDFSDYPRDHPLYSDENKKKIGYFKDELNGQPCLEFIGLRGVKVQAHSLSRLGWKSGGEESREGEGSGPPSTRWARTRFSYLLCTLLEWLCWCGF